MQNITLICTYHANKGLCTSEELYNIIERIQPEVIFEEIPPSYFAAYHEAFTRQNLETIAINAYREKHRIKNIPVDYEEMPDEAFWKNHKKMYDVIESISSDYINLVDANSVNISMYGFRYLNSQHCTDLHEKLNAAIDLAVKHLNNEKFNELHNFWREIIAKRDNVMLQNIYEYCESNQFSKGLFLVGTAHRFSIINKIKERAAATEAKISWNYEQYQGIL